MLDDGNVGGKENGVRRTRGILHVVDIGAIDADQDCAGMDEMVASGSGWGIGWMGERQDWPIAAPFLDRQSRRGRLGREMLAIAWLTALREETEKARGGSFLVP